MSGVRIYYQWSSRGWIWGRLNLPEELWRADVRQHVGTYPRKMLWILNSGACYFQLLQVQTASGQGDGGVGIVRRIRDELHVWENPTPTKPGPFVGDLPAAIFFLSNLSGFCEEA